MRNVVEALTRPNLLRLGIRGGLSDALANVFPARKLLTEIVTTAIKKGMIEEILRELSPDPAPA